MKADDLYAAHKAAVEYLAMLGKPQLHFRDGSVGKLSTCKVNTEINYQRNPGDKNYWSLLDFDKALSKVVMNNFDSLAKEAIEIMKQEAEDEFLKEEQMLLERLERIKSIKSKE